MSGTPSQSSPADGENPNSNRHSSDPEEKPRLTEEQKKFNHIASEQKRREAIRAGFDKLCDLVPGMEGQGRSESHVLRKTNDFMRESLLERRRLIQAAEAAGHYVSEDMKAPLRILEKLEMKDRQRAMNPEPRQNGNYE